MSETPAVPTPRCAHTSTSLDAAKRQDRMKRPQTYQHFVLSELEHVKVVQIPLHMLSPLEGEVLLPFEVDSFCLDHAKSPVMKVGWGGGGGGGGRGCNNQHSGQSRKHGVIVNWG